MDDSANWSSGISGPGSLFLAGMGVAFVIFCTRRLWFRQVALARGLMTEAVCVETFVTEEWDFDSNMTKTTRHMILAFRTRDGAEIRLDRTIGAHVVGDVVPVRYLPEHPERAAVATRGAGVESVGYGCGVALGLVFACLGLFFAAVGFGF
ncbi:DUF3592 domain-containing protein [Streptomyces sp. NPDC059837]|uniref:DUF3592 domain-containing protein n=1 Tax=Streptomyces sp. NPDC059837 TaxID=3346968 RepID=UPI003655AE21